MRQNLDRRRHKEAKLLCGVDEAGRGALAGPVVAAAVIMPPRQCVPGVDDSKKLSPARRKLLSLKIKETALAWAIGLANQKLIDRENIRQASFLAMRRAVLRLKVRPDLVLADGWTLPDLGLPCRGIVRGDQRSYCIACASILAKVYRDQLMERLDRIVPGYNLAKHKGYPTREHLQRLKTLGPSSLHRLTFSPVQQGALRP